MKQNKSPRRRLQIATFALTTLFLITSRKKDKKDNIELLLMARLLVGLNRSAEFNFSNINQLLAARTKNSSRFLTLPDSIGSGFLTDLAGDNPQNYGNRFAGKFLAPNTIGIEVCQIVAYKSLTKGGPAKGRETLENTNFIEFTDAMSTDVLVILLPMDASPCGAFISVGLTKIDNVDSKGLSIKQIPENERTDYDRIGIVARAFTYYFKSADVPENAYRYNDFRNPPVNAETVTSDKSKKLKYKVPAVARKNMIFHLSTIVSSLK
ncbi:hypothetical protein IQB76_01220 [Leptospira borgpetersenii serovar Hardjo-bovis]|uniref:Uncharacterized protein n=1 Tax=Leptospira borgpetersenii serovar Hardjo-bovis str. Sponselee TaxID=1303729 RepID=M6BKT3_LEPBO|nr:hypothetical protein [Leptospira borgpetersenii]ABJ80120.1 Hypothetical protein LBL_2781 [Leptospira borgpetersenii serovar Hardjo-bovis str. L550]AMX59567.1 hypothetical protein LBK6_14940 [Leptospira borgpetersenii serovar Hardjo]AMX62795.1 hypothetical protein LBK9_14860 [Leptospira borgpetersenii serovar Hardjo]AMX66038.1 hypothetical protein LBK30_14865 [Leptospira borgpetersenii serovar Hardjo]AMX69271.1 hypothetical protein LBHA_14825 [Leptospira borgpetersenii serovar Hardjo]